MSQDLLHNESAWVEALQQGDKEAFAVLYRHYSPRMYAGILRIIKDPLTTEEIIQELFTRIWLKRDVQGMRENFAGYIYRIGQHLVYDFFRKLKSDRQLKDRFRKLAEEHYDPIEEEVFQKESSQLLRQAIDQLTPQQKKVYQLVKEEGCTYKRTAEILGISPLTVKEYLVAGKKSIRHYMVNNMDSSLIMAWIITGISIA